MRAQQSRSSRYYRLACPPAASASLSLPRPPRAAARALPVKSYYIAPHFTCRFYAFAGAYFLYCRFSMASPIIFPPVITLTPPRALSTSACSQDKSALSISREDFRSQSAFRARVTYRQIPASASSALDARAVGSRTSSAVAMHEKTPPPALAGGRAPPCPGMRRLAGARTYFAD